LHVTPTTQGGDGMQRFIRSAMLVATVMAGGLTSAGPINGGVEAPTPDVFANFYAPAVPAGRYPGVGAQLYVSPRPVPPRVGHTWVTYPPFMPHEFLYQHRRRYIRPAGAMGMRNDTRAYWW
jgi:hypothetical protein